LDQTVNGTRLNTLRLCLAHFGGNTTLGRDWSEQIIALMLEYPNVHADLSSSFGNKGFRRFFKNTIYENPAFEKIRERILFGTDWYMTLLDGVDYLDYCSKTKSFLDDLDTSLWFRFTEVNPFAFYRLDEQIERIAENIIAKRQPKDIKEILGPLSIEKIDGIRKDAAYIKVVKQIHKSIL
ncbi:MAG: amidohydrolase family protein, partial [Desulfatitalea sp.]|nr:amidohydrolase family protein [Desulfatitalea sp.]